LCNDFYRLLTLVECRSSRALPADVDGGRIGPFDLPEGDK